MWRIRSVAGIDICAGQCHLAQLARRETLFVSKWVRFLTAIYMSSSTTRKSLSPLPAWNLLYWVIVITCFTLHFRAQIWSQKSLSSFYMVFNNLSKVTMQASAFRSAGQVKWNEIILDYKPPATRKSQEIDEKKNCKVQLPSFFQTIKFETVHWNMDNR